MSKDKTVSANSVLQELFHVGLYKGSQGRVTRQVTFAVLFLVVLLASWRLYELLRISRIVRDALEADWLLNLVVFGVPVLLLGVGSWVSYRLVNLPRFADFLVAVEAEMNKVSWPAKSELIRSSAVVIVVIFTLAGVLFAYDAVWRALFGWLGIQ